jgi:hypothetical protein
MLLALISCLCARAYDVNLTYEGVVTSQQTYI